MLHVNDPIFKITAVITAICVFCTPILTQAQSVDTPDDYSAGKADGERDARAPAGWFFAGCCLPLLGVLIASAAKPSPSTTFLIGKSQEYINGYIDGYKSESSKKQVSLAAKGTAVAIIVGLTIVTFGGGISNPGSR